MMDCSKCTAKCGAECCSNVPFDRSFVETHKPVREIIELVPLGDNMVVPKTASGRCPFLSEDYRCTVYKDRPRVCRVFGDESTIFATCSWQDKNGRVRSRQEKRQLDRLQSKREGQLRHAMATGDRSGAHMSVQERQRQAVAAEAFTGGMTFGEKMNLLSRAARKLLRMALGKIGL